MIPIGANDECLFGYDLDGAPVHWRPGEPPQPPIEGLDYAGWYVERFGFDVRWVDGRGEIRA